MVMRIVARMTRPLVCGLLLALGVAAQSAPPEVAIQSGPFHPQTILTSNPVAVPLVAVVRDGEGRVIAGLTRNDFEILDRDVPQTITSFAVERHAPVPASGSAAPNTAAAPNAAAASAAPASASAGPRTVALFFEDLDSSSLDLGGARRAAQAFLQAGLPAGERVGIFTSSGEHEAAFGADLATLRAVIDKLKIVVRLTPPCQGVTQLLAYQAAVKLDANAARGIGESCCPGCPGAEANGKAIADAYWDQVENQSSATLSALDGAVTALGREPGQRVMLVSGSGFIAETLRRRQLDVEQNALSHNVVINTLNGGGLSITARNTRSDPVGVDTLWAAQPTPESEQRLQREKPGLIAVDTVLDDLATDTGGTYFHNRNDLGVGMQALANGPEVEYVMSFTPDRLVADGSFHAIKVRLRLGRSADIQTRPGYYAPAREQNPSAAELTRRLNNAVMAIDESAAFPATLAVTTAPHSGTEPAKLRLAITVDARALDWTKIAGRNFEQITFAAVLSRPDGAYATGERSAMTLHLRDSTRNSMEKTGITGRMSLPVLAGAYQLRVVVMESVQGKISSFTRTVAVPNPPNPPQAGLAGWALRSPALRDEAGP